MGNNIAHLGLNFWRQLAANSSSYSFESDNAFLLCLDSDGQLLAHFFLTSKFLSSSALMEACISLARAAGASTLVRIQTRPAKQLDPFEAHSTHTKILYDAVELFDFHLAEVVLPRFYEYPTDDETKIKGAE